jgi:hypothetical protein
MRYSDWLSVALRRQRMTSFLLGTYAGLLLSVIIIGLVGFGLDRWRLREDEARISAVRSEASEELAECKTIVQRLSAEEYSAVLAIYRQVPGSR